LQIKTKIISCHTADSKPVKQEVNGTVILPPLVFPGKREGDKRERERERCRIWFIESISLLLAMTALQIKNLKVFVQNCYFKRNDGCLGLFSCIVIKELLTHQDLVSN
jgi:hypothetical protein